MALYDLGITADEARKEGNFEPLDAGPYNFRIAGWDNKPTAAGRPMHVFKLEIQGHSDPTVNGRIIFHNCVLPWTDPSSGQFTSKGIGLLSGMVEAVGLTWEGSSYDPDALIGSMGGFDLKKVPKKEKKMIDGVEQWVPVEGEFRNDIGKWHKA